MDLLLGSLGVSFSLVWRYNVSIEKQYKIKAQKTNMKINMKVIYIYVLVSLFIVYILLSRHTVYN